MAVEPGHVQMGLIQRQPHEGLRLAGLDGHAELGVHLTGADGGVGVGVNAGGDPKEHLLPPVPAARLSFEREQLLHPVHHEAAHARVHSESDVSVRLAVAVVVHPVHGEACGLGGVYLPGGDHVEAQPLALHDAAHPFEGGGLAGVEDLGARREVLLKGFRVQAAVVPDAVLVHEVQGGAVLSGQGQGVLSCEAQAALLPVHIGAKGGLRERRGGLCHAVSPVLHK